MIQGCKIHDPSVLNEGYERIDSGFVANVSAKNILPLFEGFIKLHNQWCFLILEVPTNCQEDPAFTSGSSQPLHKDVYYLDGLSPKNAIKLLNTFGNWLIHDGLSSFGIGIHSGANEIVSGKYNVVTVYTKTPETYNGFFEAHNIPEVTELKTAWDYFTVKTPGDSFLYTHNGRNIYDLVEKLKQYGLYLAERRED